MGADLVERLKLESRKTTPETLQQSLITLVTTLGRRGMGADLYELTGSILSQRLLEPPYPSLIKSMNLTAVLAPMTVAGIGTILSIIGIFFVRTKEEATQKNLCVLLLEHSVYVL